MSFNRIAGVIGSHTLVSIFVGVFMFFGFPIAPVKVVALRKILRALEDLMLFAYV